MAFLRLVPLFILSLAVWFSTPVFAGQTGGGNPSTTSGVTVNWSGVAASTAGSTGTMNGIGTAGGTTGNYWTNPAIANAPSYQFAINDPGTATVTITFSQPVDDPVLHLDRLGGYSGTSDNGTIWTLSSYAASGTVSLSQVGTGNGLLDVTANSFRRIDTTGRVTTANCAPSGSVNGTACGSVLFTGKNITSLTFNVTWYGPPLFSQEFDTIEAVWTFADAQVRYGKQSINNTGSFTFTGTNGASSGTLATTTSNPNYTPYGTVTNHANAITIAEGALPAGWSLTGVDCTALRDGSATAVAIPATLTGSTISIPDSSYSPADQLTCLFRNTDTTVQLSVTKTNGTTTSVSGTTTDYTITYNNAGPAPANGATISDTPVSGLNGCVVTNCTSTNSATCPVTSGNPFTTATVTNFPANSTVTITMRCNVN